MAADIVHTWSGQTVEDYQKSAVSGLIWTLYLMMKSQISANLMTQTQSIRPDVMWFDEGHLQILDRLCR